MNAISGFDLCKSRRFQQIRTIPRSIKRTRLPANLDSFPSPANGRLPVGANYWPMIPFREQALWTTLRGVQCWRRRPPEEFSPWRRRPARKAVNRYLNHGDRDMAERIQVRAT